MASIEMPPRIEPQHVPPDFDSMVARSGFGALTRSQATTLQVNVGKLCNQACHHCHVEAGPTRPEIMPARVANRVIELLEASPGVETLDLTGGAPELNPNFRRLVVEARHLRRRVIDRCNLTVLLETGMETLADFMAAQQVRIVASLPCYQAKNVDKQRGRGVFDKSIEALRRLNAFGYGGPGSALELDLVYNPGGAFLPPPQSQLEAQYREELDRLFGIQFNRLLTITNMPIKRFADFLNRDGQHQAYMCLLANHFNPATVGGLMCRSLVSVGWDGRIYDCDFNQMLDIEAGATTTVGDGTIWGIDSLDALTGCRISTARHCFGCTAGSGSGCSGALQ